MYNCPIGSYVKVCLTVAEGSNNFERELHNKYTLVIWLNSARWFQSRRFSIVWLKISIFCIFCKFEKVSRLFTDNDRRQLMAMKRIFVNKQSFYCKSKRADI